ncbi:MAG: hypothetical protein C0604_01310, partial [Clostridiales bacterium]
MKRKKAFRTALCIATLLAGVILVVFMTNIFIIEDCTISSDGKYVEDAFISESILGKNIFLIKAENVEKSIEEDPAIKTATLRRNLPDSIIIEIVPREKIV